MTDFLLCNTKHDFLKKCNYYSQGLKILGFKKTQSAIKHYNRKLYTKMYFTSLVNWQLCGLNGTVQHLNYSMSRSLTRHQGISDEHDRYRVWVTIWAIGLVARGAMSWRGSSAGTCTYLQWIDKKKITVSLDWVRTFFAFESQEIVGNIGPRSVDGHIWPIKMPTLADLCIWSLVYLQSISCIWSRYEYHKCV